MPFVIIGGHAVNFHGYIRTTEDADVVFERTQESEANLLRGLDSVHAKWISDEKDPATGFERQIPVTASYIRVSRLMMLSTDAGFLDIYDYIPGFASIPVSELSEGSVCVGDLRFVSLEWLRRLKERAGRHKDLDDLEHLRGSYLEPEAGSARVRDARGVYSAKNSKPLKRRSGRKR